VIGNITPDENGLGGIIVFIDTENTFRVERIFQISEHRGVRDPDDILRKIYVCKIYNTSHLEVGKSIGEYKVKLVIVDSYSVIALHRAKFTGRGTLADRQQRLNIILHKLNRLAEVHNIAVVVTNQVQSQPDDFSASRDGLRAIGRNVIGHATTYRILLRKAGARIAIMLHITCMTRQDSQ
jgi:DNA repair protein RadA